MGVYNGQTNDAREKLRKLMQFFFLEQILISNSAYADLTDDYNLLFVSSFYVTRRFSSRPAHYYRRAPNTNERIGSRVFEKKETLLITVVYTDIDERRSNNM